jgi:hypothetical protein
MTAVLEKNEVKELWCWKSDLLIKAFKLRLDSKYSHKGAPIWRNDPSLVPRRFRNLVGARDLARASRERLENLGHRNIRPHHFLFLSSKKIMEAS